VFWYRICFISLLLLYGSSLFSENKDNLLAVYLTWQNDPLTTMTVQWITQSDCKSNALQYRELGKEGWQQANGTRRPMPRALPYFIHRTTIHDLKPGTSYEFCLHKNIYKFRTMSNKLSEPLRFVVGGDMYHDEIKYMVATHRTAAKTDPMFALVGGDIAYASSKTAGKLQKDEAKRWLEWVAAWSEHMITPEGYLIPFLPAIGNHDVNGAYDQPRENAPFFYSLFAFPGSRGYGVIDFGDYLSVLILDSGHTSAIAGEQSEWLYQTLNNRTQIQHKFSLYHVPAYPAVRDFNGAISSQIRKAWVPLFEQFSLAAAFEHHDHAYKRSYPIHNGAVDSRGVLYLGDGAWGVKKPRRPKKPKRTWYLAQTKRDRHFILVTLHGHRRLYQAINAQGEVIDTAAQIAVKRFFPCGLKGCKPLACNPS